MTLHVKRTFEPGIIDALSSASREALQIFVDVLIRWNPTVNLIAKGDIAFIWSRHVEDCLQLVDLIPGELMGLRTVSGGAADRSAPTEARAIDLGSGGGFPGLVLAIATGIPFDLVEADQRKAAFLREAARLTGAPARVHDCRAEDVRLAPAPLLTARALAPLPRLLTLARRLVTPDGMCLLLKGARADVELTQAAQAWSIKTERFPSWTSGDAAILRISKFEPAPRIR